MKFVKFYHEDTGSILRLGVSFLRAGVMFALMWAKQRGDKWGKEKPGDMPFIWTRKIFYKKVVIRNIYFGRLAISFGIRRKIQPTDETVRKTFAEDLTLISDPAYREFAVACLKEAPLEFWLYPASVLEYPKWACGEGGLIWHTKATIRIALDLLKAFPELEPEKDAIITALLLHDTCKINSETGKMDNNHPLLTRKQYEKFADMLPAGAYDEIMTIIETHEGVFGPLDALRMAPAIPERISTALLVHLANYIAGQGWISSKIFFRHS